MQEHFTPTVAKAIAKKVQNKLQSNTENKTTNKMNTPKKQSTPNKQSAPKKQSTPKRQSTPKNTPKRTTPKKQPNKKVIQPKKQSKKQSKKNIMSKTIPKSNINVPVIKQSPKPPKVQPPKVQPTKVQPPKVQPQKVKISTQPKINPNANLRITPVKSTIPKKIKEKFIDNPLKLETKNSISTNTPSTQSGLEDSTQKINNLINKNTPTTSVQTTVSNPSTINLSSNVPKENIPSFIPKDEIQENILNLNIQKLVTLSLKAIMDTIGDLTILYNSNRITVMNVFSIVLKDNRIMYLGTGFFMLSVAMYIFNNFLRIPSFGGFLSSGERRVFINNY